MLSLVTNSTVRPSRLSDNKNLNYHADCARYYCSGINKQKYHDFLQKCLVRWAFYKGEQWLFEEDLKPFLMDESGESRNRIRLVENIIRPMVKMLKNNAILTDYTFKAQAINPFAVTRKERELNRMLALSELAGMLGEEGSRIIKNNFLVGDSSGETQDMFEERYVDKLVQGINYLMNYYTLINNLEDLKNIGAEYYAVTGLVVSREYEYHGNQAQKLIEPETFFWDTNNTMPYLYDGDYMGHWELSTPNSIFERYQFLKPSDREAIELASQHANANDWSYVRKYLGLGNGRVPEVRVEWKDMERQQWGWVKEAGVEAFVRINYKGGKYKTKDCIRPSKEEDRAKLNSGNTLIKDFGVTRFCHFVPREYLNNQKNDVILEWGIIPYSDQSYILPDDNPFTYKAMTYEYHNGIISAPIDDAIDPQRLINRINSMGESVLNNARGAGSVFDKDNIDPEDGEEGVMRNVNMSKPVFLVNTGGNVQNAIGKYDTNSAPTINVLFNAKEMYSQAIKNNIGINDAIMGSIGGKRELVGVADTMVKQGSIMQEGYYNGIGKWMLQIYQSMAHRGKCIAIDNQTVLYNAVGDRLSTPIILSKESINEYFRVFVTRTTPESDQKNVANAFALQLLQLGLLDQPRFAQVFNNGTIDDVARFMREFVAENQQIQKQMAEVQSQAMAGQQMIDAQDRQAERDNKLQAVELQNQGRVAQELAKPRPVPNQ